ncbi:hypothetical protein [Rhodopirellula baltica]|uniref:hypothetical protein n=1 Tax=Rhodopirellula baltica TaxID=265606 RepID=UPI0002F4781A|nr:hypothetical protein [Rhodopirellula baltica]
MAPSLADHIFDWLESKSNAALDGLLNSPEDSFAAVLDYRGAYPDGMDPRDAHGIHLVNLLSLLLFRFPELLTNRELKTIPVRQRYCVVNAAITADSKKFRDFILGGLRDRSIYVKTLVLDAIVRHPALRTPTAHEMVKRLLLVKSVVESDYDRRHVEAALASFRCA